MLKNIESKTSSELKILLQFFLAGTCFCCNMHCICICILCIYACILCIFSKEYPSYFHAKNICITSHTNQFDLHTNRTDLYGENILDNWKKIDSFKIILEACKMHSFASVKMSKSLKEFLSSVRKNFLKYGPANKKVLKNVVEDAKYKLNINIILII